MKVTKAIIPAGGLGTRFLPITKSLAKEMLPIIDKPCIQYLVEEAVASGIKEIIIITNNNKHSIEDYFTPSPELYKQLKAKGKLKELKEIQKVDKLAKFTFIQQPFAGGDGHAILCAQKLIKNEPFAVLFGDDIYDSKIPALAQLINQYKKVMSPVIGIAKINKRDSKKYGMIKAKQKSKGLYQIESLVEKPNPSNAPSSLAITGKYIITPELYNTLKKTKPGKDKELRIIDGMKNFVKDGNPIFGFELSGARFDTGDKQGYLQAIVHFAKKLQ